MLALARRADAAGDAQKQRHQPAVARLNRLRSALTHWVKAGGRLSCRKRSGGGERVQPRGRTPIRAR